MKKLLYITKLYLICLIFIAFTNTSCTDYGYRYYYSVGEGHGTIVAVLNGKSYISENSPLGLRGGKSGKHNLIFKATPESGYEIKNLICNGEVLSDNSDTLTIEVKSHTRDYYIEVNFRTAE